jgi:hypothetical protein
VKNKSGGVAGGIELGQAIRAGDVAAVRLYIAKNGIRETLELRKGDIRDPQFEDESTL